MNTETSKPLNTEATPSNKSNLELLKALLKEPLTVVQSIDKGSSIPLPPLLLLITLSLVLFGLILGSFHGLGHLMWQAPLKVLIGITFSCTICLPSLYIFCCIGELNVKLKTITAILLSMVAIICLLLVGFTPVIWLFSASSNSVGFFGFLVLGIWIICLGFGLKFLLQTASKLGMKRAKHLLLWSCIFTTVTLQMPTTLRPLIGSGEGNSPFINLDEKKFFLQHWFESIVPRFDLDSDQSY